MTNSLSEIEHNIRAQHLLELFLSESNLAEFLHQNYRATAKSFGVKGPLHHDHGWCDCYGKPKKYFLRRARWLMTTNANFNGRVK